MPPSEAAWALLLAASAAAAGLERAGAACSFRFDPELDPGLVPGGGLQPVGPGDTAAVLTWGETGGWSSQLQADDPRGALVDLYLPLCSATPNRPITVGHLGQSLDGFIATPTGDSQFVTGSENILHLHRMRALADAVVVGAGTVAADDPQLTTRLVAGPNPLRVVLDPARRLAATYRVFTDAAAPTLYVCAQSRVRAGETQMGLAAVVGIDVGIADSADGSVADAGAGDEIAQVMKVLRAHGCSRVFVEGGGVTVSAFLEANLLDRLQMAIAPLLIGDGRPAIRLAPHANLRDCRRPRYRVFRMGGDVLFDCDLKASDDAPPPPAPSVSRVI